MSNPGIDDARLAAADAEASAVPGDAPVVLKQYGLPRSGTNALKLVLERNYNIRVLTSVGGSKHAPPCLSACGVAPDGAVVSVKEPLAWLASLWRHAAGNPEYNMGRGFKAYLRAALGCPQGYYKLWYASPSSAWNCANRTWAALRLGDRPVMVVRSEDLLDRDEAIKTCDEVAKRCGARRRSGMFYLPAGRMTATGGGAAADDHPPREEPDRPFDPAWYTARRFMSGYAADDIAMLRVSIDWHLAAVFGYQPPEMPRIKLAGSGGV